MSWGHVDYMNLVAKENGTTLPHAALFIVRYHSFYPLHKAGAYTHLMNDEDRESQLSSGFIYSNSRVEEKKAGEDELVTDGGFVVPNFEASDGLVAPDINFMGQINFQGL